jgi:CelD/BcsL family acetyltransferase involved in cellulose biosynthesis
LDAATALETPPMAAPRAGALPRDIHVAIHEDLAAVAEAWRTFERDADGTVFQTFEWLDAWHRHVGIRSGVRPAIVVGRGAAGEILFLIPLAVRHTGLARELAFLGSDLCDYNAPLLAPLFSDRVGRPDFPALWREIARQLQDHPRLHYDLVNLSKMPETVGAQNNPMLSLAVTAHPSGAYLAHLDGDWESFYTAKRSSTTRRRDRTKRKRLAELGEVQLVTPQGKDEVTATLDTLMAQKARAFARMGVANLFARSGYAEFYRAIATEPASSQMVHVSRLDVGRMPAATNFGLIHRGCYYHLLASYGDGEASRFGPGAAHLHDLMRIAIERGCRIFDFTIGDEPYKRDWSDTELKLYDHISFVSLRGALVAAPLMALRRVKRAIKQTPALWALASKARALAGSLRRSTS